ncbi:MAG: amidase [Alphaproteobacteria bacterium]|nr:amidase [Alphaproteobacteria bacterium]
MLSCRNISRPSSPAPAMAAIAAAWRAANSSRVKCSAITPLRDARHGSSVSRIGRPGYRRRWRLGAPAGNIRHDLFAEGDMDELNRLTATEAAARIARGDLTSEALVKACLARIEARESTVGAWEYWNPELALRQARECDRVKPAGALHGVPIGFKDIIDTADMPTAFGSRVHLGRRPTADAASVALAKEAGGVVLGKTVTTEFAGRYPGKTSNPHNRAHTPGGSSSGSAAAVADFQVPLAVGSQTAGSMIRPASYCGVYGFKPTFGAIPLVGACHISESFDTLGIMARSIDDAELFFSVLMAQAVPKPGRRMPKPPRLAFCRTPYWDKATPAGRAAIEGGAAKLAKAGFSVTELKLPAAFDAAQDLIWNIISYDLARDLAHEHFAHKENMSSPILSMFAHGRSIPFADHVRRKRDVERLRHEITAVFADFDLIYAPSSIGEADLGLTETGAVWFNSIWHVMDLPCLTVPAFTGPTGLPIGAQLVARRWDDYDLLAHARRVDEALK